MHSGQVENGQAVPLSEDIPFSKSVKMASVEHREAETAEQHHEPALFIPLKTVSAGKAKTSIFKKNKLTSTDEGQIHKSSTTKANELKPKMLKRVSLIESSSSSQEQESSSSSAHQDCTPTKISVNLHNNRRHTILRFNLEADPTFKMATDASQLEQLQLEFLQKSLKLQKQEHDFSFEESANSSFHSFIPKQEVPDNPFDEPTAPKVKTPPEQQAQAGRRKSILGSISESQVIKLAEENQIFELKAKDSSLLPMLIIPWQSNLLQLWELLQVILNLGSSISIVFGVAYYPQLTSSSRDTFYYLSLFVEIAFMLDLAVHLLVDSSPSHRKAKDIRKVIKKNLQDRFVLDFITAFPFSKVMNRWISPTAYRLLYLLKVLRLEKAFLLFNTKSFQKQLKAYQDSRIKRVISKSRKKANSNLDDYSKLSWILFISKIHKAIQLIAIVLCLSYFCGLLWYMMVDLIGDKELNFVSSFALDQRSLKDTTIALTYFVFTSLSTVGLGDFHPVSDVERIAGAIVLLFGVMTTSFVMENFSCMISQIKNFNESYEDSKDLNLFVGTLKRYNGNRQLPSVLITRMEDYFKYRWENNKNQAVLQEEDDRQLFEVLPSRVRRSVYTEFLYENFLGIYKGLFRIISTHKRITSLKRQRFKIISNQSIMESKNQQVYDTSFEQMDCYLDFVVRFLQALEPRLHLQIQFQGQFEAVEEAIFPISGEVEIGYDHHDLLKTSGIEVSVPDQERKIGQLQSRVSFRKRLDKKRFHFPLTTTSGQPIGFFEILFTRKSQFIYRLKAEREFKPTEVFFLRKKVWAQVAAAFAPDLIEQFKTKVLIDYVDKVYLPLKGYQDRLIGLAKIQNNRPLANIITLMRGRFSTAPQKASSTKNSKNEQAGNEPEKSSSSSEEFRSIAEEEASVKESQQASRSSSASAVSSEVYDASNPMDRPSLLGLVTEFKLTRAQRRKIKTLSKTQETHSEEVKFGKIIEGLQRKIALFEKQFEFLYKQNENLKVDLLKEQLEVTRLTSLLNEDAGGKTSYMNQADYSRGMMSNQDEELLCNALSNLSVPKRPSALVQIDALLNGSVRQSSESAKLSLASFKPRSFRERTHSTVAKPIKHFVDFSPEEQSARRDTVQPKPSGKKLLGFLTLRKDSRSCQGASHPRRRERSESKKSSFSSKAERDKPILPSASSNSSQSSGSRSSSGQSNKSRTIEKQRKSRRSSKVTMKQASLDLGIDSPLRELIPKPAAKAEKEAGLVPRQKHKKELQSSSSSRSSEAKVEKKQFLQTEDEKATTMPSGVNFQLETKASFFDYRNKRKSEETDLTLCSQVHSSPQALPLFGAPQGSSPTNAQPARALNPSNQRNEVEQRSSFQAHDFTEAPSLRLQFFDKVPSLDSSNCPMRFGKQHQLSFELQMSSLESGSPVNRTQGNRDEFILMEVQEKSVASSFSGHAHIHSSPPVVGEKEGRLQLPRGPVARNMESSVHLIARAQDVEDRAFRSPFEAGEASGETSEGSGSHLPIVQPHQPFEHQELPENLDEGRQEHQEPEKREHIPSKPATQSKESVPASDSLEAIYFSKTEQQHLQTNPQQDQEVRSEQNDGDREVVHPQPLAVQVTYPKGHKKIQRTSSLVFQRSLSDVSSQLLKMSIHSYQSSLRGEYFEGTVERGFSKSSKSHRNEKKERKVKAAFRLKQPEGIIY